MTTQQQNNVRNLAGGASVAMVGRFAGRFTAIIADIIAARVLGPALFGIYSIGWTIFRLVELIAPLGLDLGVIRYGSLYLDSDRSALKNVIVNSLKGTLLVGIPLTILFFLGAPWLAAIFNKPDLVFVIRLLSLGFPLTGLLSVLAAATRLTHDMRYTVILQDLGQPLLAFILLIVFLLAGTQLVGVLLSDVLSYGVLVLLGFYYLHKLFPDVMSPSAHIQAAGSADLIMFSIASSLTMVMNTLVFWVDRLLIGYYLPASDSGIYQAVSQISVIFAVVLSAFSRIVIPILAGLHHNNRKDEMEEIYRVSTKWGIYISLPVLLVLLLAPRDVLAATYGPAYTSGADLILILLAGQTINLITGPVGPLLVATGHQNFTFALSGFSLLLNIALNSILVPRWGLSGAAIATTISLSVLYVVALFAAKRKLDLWPYDRRYWKGCLAALVSLMAVSVTGLLPVASILVSLALKFFVATAVFFAMLLLMKLDEEDIELIRLLRGNRFTSKSAGT